MAYHVSTVLYALSFISTTVARELPYNPTSILIPPASSPQKNIAYVFLQGANSNHQLSGLNFSSIVYASNYSLETITPNLPFDDKDPFIPIISAAGDVSVYSGSCSDSVASTIWRFTPSDTSLTKSYGTWAQDKTESAGGTTSASLLGPNFLTPGFGFSTLVESNVSDTTLYIFGGMCPSSNATEETWQSSALYSNAMLKFEPTASTSAQTSYTLSLDSSRSPPVAEAGFSVTGLTPTILYGSGIATQQQNFLLLGGHTANAFINMSQVAIWSLPEENWSFVTIDSSPLPGNANLELTAKSTAISVDSRSGHTATLTEDGSKIVVLGGWVGDVGQAADPQLAILDLGTGFGGSGNWVWSIPDNQPSGSGIYGHGAVMLPGNVMMFLGGYSISTSGSTRRDLLQTQGIFFNATSLSWISNYTNPSYTIAFAAKDSTAANSSTAKKIGLGVGLGLGLLALLAALIFFLGYSRHLRHKRQEAREKDLRILSFGAAGYYHPPTREMGQRSAAFPWTNNGWNNGNNGGYNNVYDESNSALAGYENVHSGVYDVRDDRIIQHPSRQIPRKPLHSKSARGIYQPTPDHARSNSLGTAGPIHPIYEADEDGDQVQPHSDAVEPTTGDLATLPDTSNSNRYSDPFKDSHLNSGLAFSGGTVTGVRRNRSVSTNGAESPAESREREIQEWVSDWAAADILLHQQARSHSNAGRISPTRRAQIIAASTISSVTGEEGDGRTGSNLSERTDLSIAISGINISRSGSVSQDQRSRSDSLRGFIGGINIFGTTSTTGASTNLSPIFDGSDTLGSSYNGLLNPNSSPPKSAGSGSGKSANSFATAHTSFRNLQAEGETLLPRPGHVEDFSSPEHSPTDAAFETPGSPSKSKPRNLSMQGRGWLGSLRRVFSPDSGNGYRTPTTFRSPASNIQDLTAERHETYENSSSQPPRRTVSAGATLWRRKQGKGDWDDSVVISTPTSTGRATTLEAQSRNDMLLGPDASYGVEEDEWDIERAVENRVVQVMFTVPKEKLRVVNHDFGNDDGSEGGESLRSRNGSFKVRKLKSFTEISATRREQDAEESGIRNVSEQEKRHLSVADQKDVPKTLSADQEEEAIKREDGQPSLATEAKRLVKTINKGKSREVREDRSPSPRRKGNSKVLEMVDKMEGRSSPERSPER